MADEITVSVAQVEAWRDTVNSAYYHSLSEDLVQQYRLLSQRDRTSALTKALESTLGSLNAYLESVKEETNEDDDVRE